MTHRYSKTAYIFWFFILLVFTSCESGEPYQDYMIFTKVEKDGATFHVGAIQGNQVMVVQERAENKDVPERAGYFIDDEHIEVIADANGVLKEIMFYTEKRIVAHLLLSNIRGDVVDIEARSSSGYKEVYRDVQLSFDLLDNSARFTPVVIEQQAGLFFLSFFSNFGNKARRNLYDAAGFLIDAGICVGGAVVAKKGVVLAPVAFKLYGALLTKTTYSCVSVAKTVVRAGAALLDQQEFSDLLKIYGKTVFAENILSGNFNKASLGSLVYYGASAIDYVISSEGQRRDAVPKEPIHDDYDSYYMDCNVWMYVDPDRGLISPAVRIPREATITLNNQVIENFSQEFYEPGFYVIQISHPGYNTYTRRFQLSKSDAEIIEVDLEPIEVRDGHIKVNEERNDRGATHVGNKVSIRITVTPNDAKVSLFDMMGKEIKGKQGDALFQSLDKGYYFLEIKRQGYETMYERLDLTIDSNQKLNVILNKSNQITKGRSNSLNECHVLGRDGYAYFLSIERYDIVNDYPNLQALLESRYGKGVVMADWNDLVQNFENQIDYFYKELCIEERLNIGITLNNKFLYSSNRAYLFTRFDGNVRRSFLVHRNIRNNTISLGSWHGERKILLKKKL
ncbi:MAG: hypothetical protein JJU02_06950 [Cryomorphaceae bacterium]|nr:hypothetical protein [Cryomorphaceae bacterium]